MGHPEPPWGATGPPHPRRHSNDAAALKAPQHGVGLGHLAFLAQLPEVAAKPINLLRLWPSAEVVEVRHHRCPRERAAGLSPPPLLLSKRGAVMLLSGINVWQG
jgi:hypothetical protein